MTRGALRRLSCAAVPLLLLLHNDVWLWGDRRMLLGLPIGMTYHVLYCLAAAGVMTMLVLFAWPAHLEGAPPDASAAGRGGERRP
ncbi:MAG TPA: DUF3311 domain-containing protein [Candidatus Polarisedimenticolia bacterium]|nr:DUF3311 domain-containing protein [Candidatus Polarisedimenticolia bacterium]